MRDDFDNVSVRKAQEWLNDHLGEFVKVSVRWRGLEPLVGVGHLHLAADLARSDFQREGEDLLSEHLSALDLLGGMYAVGVDSVPVESLFTLNLEELATSDTQVRLSETGIGFVLEPMESPRGTPIISIDVDLQSRASEDDS